MAAHGHGEESKGEQSAREIVPVRGLENFYARGSFSPYVSVFKGTLDHGLFYWAGHSMARGYFVERARLPAGGHMNPDKVWQTTKAIGMKSVGPILGTWFGYNVVRRMYIESGTDARSAASSLVPAGITAVPIVALQVAQKSFRPNMFTAGLVYALSWAEIQRLFLLRPYIGNIGKPSNL